MRINNFSVERDQCLVGVGSAPQIQRRTQVLDHDHVPQEVGRHPVVATVVADQLQHGAAHTFSRRQCHRHTHRNLLLDRQAIPSVKDDRASRSGREGRGRTERDRDETGTALALGLEVLDGFHANVVGVDDDIPQPFTQHGLQSRLQLGRRLNNIGHHAAHPAHAPGPMARHAAHTLLARRGRRGLDELRAERAGDLLPGAVGVVAFAIPELPHLGANQRAAGRPGRCR